MRGTIQVVRLLLRHQGYTATAVLVLGLGIGAVSAVFSVADPLLERSLPVHAAGELVIFNGPADVPPYRSDLVPYALFDRLRSGSSTLSTAFLSFERRLFLLAKLSNDQEPSLPGDGVRAELVSGGYFDGLGVTAEMGRVVVDSDDTRDATLVAVISHGLWLRRFGGSPDIIGQEIRFESLDFPEMASGRGQVIPTATVVGVVSRGFFGVDADSDSEVWLPLHAFVGGMSVSTAFFMGVPDPDRQNVRLMARLRPGATTEEVQSEVDVLSVRLEEGVTERGGDEMMPIQIRDGRRGYSQLRVEYADPVYLLGAAAGLVLLIACANVAGLTLGLISARRHDLAIRRFLGGRPWHIAAPVISETLILTVMAGMLALLVSSWGGRVLASYLPPEAGLLSRLGIDARVLAFTGIVSTFSMIMFASVPVLRVWTWNLRATRTLSTRYDASPTRLSNVIVGGQVALSVALVLTAGLLFRTLENLRRIDTGVDESRIIEFSVDGRLGQAWLDFVATIDRLTGMPGVEAVASYGDSGDGGIFSSERVNSTVRREGLGPSRSAAQMAVSPGFFETMRIPLVFGREFRLEELQPPQNVVIISESLAEYLFGERNVVGQMVGIDPAGGFFPGRTTEQAVRVIGVARDFIYGEVRQGSRWIAYHPNATTDPRTTRFLVRTGSGSVSDLFSQLAGVVSDMEGDFQVSEIHTLAQIRENSIGKERSLAQLAGGFALMALLLASIGIYGALSNAVAGRTHEIGIRMAIGARARDVLWLFMKKTLGTVVLGVATGLATAFIISRLLTGLLFGVASFDPIATLGAVVVLTAAASAAGYVPMRRAIGIDPCVTLRHD